MIKTTTGECGIMHLFGQHNNKQCKTYMFHEKTLFTSKGDLNLRKKLVKYYIWGIALYGTETGLLGKYKVVQI